MTVMNYTMTVVDSKHHEHRVVGISKDSYTTKLTLDDGACISVSHKDIEDRDLVPCVYGPKATEYYVSIKRVA